MPICTKLEKQIITLELSWSLLLIKTGSIKNPGRKNNKYIYICIYTVKM